MSTNHTHRADVPGAVAADRAAGVVLASAAGDALGAGYEFGPPRPHGSPVGMVGGGVFGWAQGEWTDDTQMALAILSVVATGRADVSEVEAQFRTWYAGGPTDVGLQTRAVLSASCALSTAAADYAASHPTSAAGNGSLMRTGPVVLAYADQPAVIAELARELSSLTHADADCVDACVLWSVAIDHTIHHAPSSDEPWDWRRPLRAALDHLPPGRRSRWATRIDEAESNPQSAFDRNGWVVHAFQAALSALCTTPVPDALAPGRHLQLTLENVVRAGGDTDTVAAIAGAMLGARWGATAVPLRWRRLLHGADPTGQRRTAADLERLARLAYRNGRPDPQGWPGCAHMIDQYRANFSLTPTMVELGGVRFGNAAAVPDAVDADVDVVISLCRMGTDDVPTHIEHHVLGLLDTTAEENPNLDLLLSDTVDTVHQLTQDQRSVFVHCVAAENRTPTVAALWLARYHGHTAEQALEVTGSALHLPKPFLRDAVRRLASP